MQAAFVEQDTVSAPDTHMKQSVGQQGVDSLCLPNMHRYTHSQTHTHTYTH